MKIEPGEYLYRYCVDFREEHGRLPTELELEAFVRADVIHVDSPFSPLSEDRRRESVRQAFEDFEINELEKDEISVKTRDAEANLNNRRYNDANF